MFKNGKKNKEKYYKNRKNFIFKFYINDEQDLINKLNYFKENTNITNHKHFQYLGYYLYQKINANENGYISLVILSFIKSYQLNKTNRNYFTGFNIWHDYDSYSNDILKIRTGYYQIPGYTFIKNNEYYNPSLPLDLLQKDKKQLEYFKQNMKTLFSSP